MADVKTRLGAFPGEYDEDSDIGDRGEQRGLGAHDVAASDLIIISYQLFCYGLFKLRFCDS